MKDSKAPVVFALAGVVAYELGKHPVDGRPHVETGEGDPPVWFGTPTATITSSAITVEHTSMHWLSRIKAL